MTVKFRITLDHHAVVYRAVSDVMSVTHAWVSVVAELSAMLDHVTAVEVDDIILK